MTDFDHNEIKSLPELSDKWSEYEASKSLLILKKSDCLQQYIYMYTLRHEVPTSHIQQVKPLEDWLLEII